MTRSGSLREFSRATWLDLLTLRIRCGSASARVQLRSAGGFKRAAASSEVDEREESIKVGRARGVLQGALGSSGRSVDAGSLEGGLLGVVPGAALAGEAGLSAGGAGFSAGRCAVDVGPCWRSLPIVSNSTSSVEIPRRSRTRRTTLRLLGGGR